LNLVYVGAFLPAALSIVAWRQGLSALRIRFGLDLASSFRHVQQAHQKEFNMQSDTQDKKTLDAADLAQFTGTEQWYRHSINRTVLYTDGAQYVAEHGGAYWLLDEIALIQPYDKIVAAEEFQVWVLTVHTNHTATLTCGDGNGNTVFSKEIEYTDFPLDAITFYFTNNVIHLPSEY
jgi:hypothetical protein